MEEMEAVVHSTFVNRKGRRTVIFKKSTDRRPNPPKKGVIIVNDFPSDCLLRVWRENLTVPLLQLTPAEQRARFRAGPERFNLTLTDSLIGEEKRRQMGIGSQALVQIAGRLCDRCVLGGRWDEGQGGERCKYYRGLDSNEG